MADVLVVFRIDGIAMDTRPLSSEQAYLVMLAFLEGLYRRTRSDDLGAILGGLALLKDGRPADPAALSDWNDAVNSVLADL